MSRAPGAAAKAERRAAAQAARKSDISLVYTRTSERDAGDQREPGRKAGPEGRTQAVPPPRAVLPRSVLRCGCDALYTWKKADPSLLMRSRLLCGSWRHAGLCARHEASVTYARIKEAVEHRRPLTQQEWPERQRIRDEGARRIQEERRRSSLAERKARRKGWIKKCQEIEIRSESRELFDRRGWVFLVLTLDRNGWKSGRKPWKDPSDAYRQLSQMWRNFMGRLRRLCVRSGWPSPQSNWVSVVEAHRSGWPHVNAMLYSPELAEELAGERQTIRDEGARRIRLERRQAGVSERGARRSEWRRRCQAIKRESMLMRGELLEIATATKSGETAETPRWGVQSTAERVRSRGALAHYFTKLAGSADATTGELAKLSQAPMNAAQGFRRLRSGKGFLPPRRKNPEYTGTLIRREPDPSRSAHGAVPLVNIRDPDVQRIAEQCCELEGERVEREYRARKLSALSGIAYEDFAPESVEHFRLNGMRYVLIEDSERFVPERAPGSVSRSSACRRNG